VPSTVNPLEAPIRVRLRGTLRFRTAVLLQRIFDKFYYRRLRNAAGSTPFAIVSNNCWGAHVYQQLGLPYSTPFVGLFLRPACYLTLLGDFDRIVHGELRFVDESRYPDIKAKRTTGAKHPIAILADAVEVNFLHEKTEAEARDKWQRRVARMPADPSRRFYKFCDVDRPSESQLRAFGALPLPHKVMFVAKPLAAAKTAIVVSSGEDRVPDGMALQTACLPYFDHASWLAGCDPRPGALYRAIQRGRA
jgi:uncharacterized protein (DUF1919 family)